MLNWSSFINFIDIEIQINKYKINENKNITTVPYKRVGLQGVTSYMCYIYREPWVTLPPYLHIFYRCIEPAF